MRRRKWVVGGEMEIEVEGEGGRVEGWGGRCDFGMELSILFSFESIFPLGVKIVGFSIWKLFKGVGRGRN
jgi:hypothetical protein